MPRDIKLPRRFFLLMAFLAALSLGSAPPALAVTCHCFQDRTYDPAQPAAVEPYLRATAGNSLLSAVYGVPKGDLVRKLMGGTSAPDLWVAHYLATNSTVDSETWLRGRAEGKSWASLLAGKQVPAPLTPVLAAGDSSGEGLAAAVVKEVLIKDMKADPADLAQAEKSNGSYQELILSVLASRWTERPAGALAAEVKAGKTSWGALLEGAGVAPDQIDVRIPPLLSGTK